MELSLGSANRATGFARPSGRRDLVADGFCFGSASLYADLRLRIPCRRGTGSGPGRLIFLICSNLYRSFLPRVVGGGDKTCSSNVGYCPGGCRRLAIQQERNSVVP